MAIHHCSVTVMKRRDHGPKGSTKPVRGHTQSIVGAAAYRSGSKLKDERLDMTHDFTGKAAKGITYSEILAPEHTPEWMTDREKLWNAVEKREDEASKLARGNPQLAREVECALPVELLSETHQAMVKEFAGHFVDQGMIADCSIHEPKPNYQGERNPHAHILLTMRDIDGDGFGKKNRAWNSWDNTKHSSGESVETLRERWADICNRELEVAGVDDRVDHRSFERQGVTDKLPSIHQGIHATAMQNRGERTERGDKQRLRAVENAGLAVQASGSDPVFEQEDTDLHAQRMDKARREQPPPKLPDSLQPSRWQQYELDRRQEQGRELEPEL